MKQKIENTPDVQLAGWWGKRYQNFERITICAPSDVNVFSI